MNYRNIFIALATISGGISASAQAAESATVAFLMPDQASTRYEQHDFPGFKAEMSKLCAECKVIYQNANASATLQQQQFNSVIAQGAKIIVLDPVDSSAAAALVENAQAQDVKVIAYDRPIPDKPADFYVSFDNEGIGYAISQSLVNHLQESGVPKGAGVLQINGSPTDAAAGLIRDGIHRGLKASGYTTLAEFDTPEWAPPKRRSGPPGRSPASGTKLKASSRPMTAPAAAPLPLLKPPAYSRFRRSPGTTRRLPRCSSSSLATSTTPSPNRQKSLPRPRRKWP